jgi:hypothetical protein
VTIDLGWPWWASTALAGGIAACCVLGLFFVRQAGVQGALATLAVLGAAFAIAAPFVMDDESMSAAGPALTRDEYAQRADANCRRFGQFAATLGNPKTLPGVARQLDRLMPGFWRSYGQQGILVPPSDESGSAMAWMHAMALVGRDFEAVHTAAKRNDAASVKAANARVNAHAGKAAEVSTKLGMKVCFH